MAVRKLVINVPSTILMAIVKNAIKVTNWIKNGDVLKSKLQDHQILAARLGIGTIKFVFKVPTDG